ncbi:hypothetical protein CEQ15_11385 [Chryseobacterium indologenes]|uniref:hypothetical protein n=1 Tax=Chryseobacterium indologenes TaxID=253 RepID=UPI000B516138|nr:hypothetical protein [Chryseobacterium indologenes]ASE62051.1 hypothetical protein CEQ15_11385 [Chryseobacterium indologenes]
MASRLPIINIEGIDFLVDSKSEVLREKENEKNIIHFSHMNLTSKGYEFVFNLQRKNMPLLGDFERNINTDYDFMVTIPLLTELDPEGMAEKYKIPTEKIKTMHDFECRITEGSQLDQRYNKGVLPEIEIMGNIYIVDLRNHKLTSKLYPGLEDLSFDTLSEYYDRERKAYLFPYNPQTRKIEESDLFSITEFPKDERVVRIPNQYNLDYIGWMQIHHSGSKHVYTEKDVNLKQIAYVLPWEETNVMESIRMNVAALLMPTDQNDFPALSINNFFKKPTDQDRKLPIYNLGGHDFIVDVNQLELREKGNEKNSITIEEMSELSFEGYKFWYDTINHKLASWAEPGAVEISIPDFVRLDPEGMAKKYNLHLDQITFLNDYDLMVDHDLYEKIAHQNHIPTIEIDGHLFYVDAFNKKLRPENDMWSRGISYSDISYYYSKEQNAYLIPYNRKTHSFHEAAPLDLLSSSEDITIVRIPTLKYLDPIRYNLKNNNNKSDFLKNGNLKLNHTALIIPLDKTLLAQTYNSKKERNSFDLQFNRPKEPKKNRGRKI